MFGTPIIGWLGDQFQKKKTLMALCACSLLLLSLFISFFKQSHTPLTLIFFLFGFCIGSQTLIYPIIFSEVERDSVTTALGFASMILMGLGVFAQPLFVFLLSQNQASLFLLTTSILSIILSLFIRR